VNVSTSDETWAMSAGEIAGAIRSRRVSSEEVVRAHLTRIVAVNPAVNAVTVLLEEEALAAARQADRVVASGDDLPPFHGVPFTVKACIDLLGTATSAGLKMFEDAYPTRDSPHVERLRAAGAIPLGHTNLASYAVRWHCESELWGETINPWDPSRTPGASSGGDAAALATGMTPLGVGGDGLGSLRWPAQCCGISVLRPTLGRIPTATTVEPVDAPLGGQLLIVEGPMARRVGDLRAALEVMAGPSWRDPWSAPAPLRGPDLPKPLHVALVVDPAGGGIDPQVLDGVRRAGAALQEAGYVVEEVEPPEIAEAASCAVAMLNTPEFRSVLPMLPAFPAATERFLSEFYREAGEQDAVASMQVLITRHRLLRAWGEFQLTHPLIVAPICTDIPFEVGTDLEDGAVARTISDMRMAIAVNALGLPAVAVPVGLADGLPQVVQVIGARYREDLCLDGAQAIEDRLGIITPIDPKGR
jgi:amidase